MLKSFDVTGGDSAKNLDDNKKAQVKGECFSDGPFGLVHMFSIKCRN